MLVIGPFDCDLISSDLGSYAGLLAFGRAIKSARRQILGDKEAYCIP